MIKLAKQIIYNILFPKHIHIAENSNLRGKVVVITGASRGIGKSITEVLFKQGANIVAVSRNKKDLESTFNTFDKNRILFVDADITFEKDCIKIVSEAVRKFQRVDVLINNAGIFSGKQLELTSSSEWEKGIQTNISSMFFLTKAVIPVMKKQKVGQIINIGSKVSKNTNVSPKMVLYATAKYAVEGFSFALGRELKPFNIRVNCIMPGTVATVPSLQSLSFLSPYRIAQLVLFMITMEDIDFENIIIKSNKQINL